METQKIKQNMEAIQSKLKEFSIEVVMDDVNIGATFIQYTLRPANGVKVSKINALRDDLMLALASKSIRIEAPIPGTSLIGIEIPREEREVVKLEHILEEKYIAFKDSLRERSSICAMGKNSKGETIYGDLKDMPHLLIAGSTGSGKSMFINSFLLSLLHERTPEDIQLILIDPKHVELAHYQNSKHLFLPIVNDTDEAILALEIALDEMKRRYKLLHNAGYRNITEYNENEIGKMSLLVIVIDELAELMQRSTKDEAESLICRLAQMARAVGIHLILATQRPSVDVITGLIKANIPARVAFAVASGVDSRTIIDTQDAKDLLGAGDMIYMDATSKKQRIQGAYIDGEGIRAMIK